MSASTASPISPPLWRRSIGSAVAGAGSRRSCAASSHAIPPEEWVPAGHRRVTCGTALSSLKGWVFVNRLLTSGFAGFRPPCRQHWVRAGGQDGAPAALARTNGLDAGPARCMLSAMPEDQRRDCVVVGSFSMLRWADTLGQGRIGSGCRSSLRPAGVGMERCGSNTRGQSSWRPRRVGGQTVQRPRACCVRGAHPALRARARMCPSRSP